MLESIYRHSECGLLPNLADGDDMERAILSMLNEIWKEKGMPTGLINREVTTLISEKLWAGVSKGFQATLDSIDWDTPDWNMLASLQRDVWHFSSAKNYTELRQLSGALIGPDGKLRTRSEWMNEAIKINNRAVTQHLSAEYELAVTSSQMAGKWVDIQADKDIFPLLSFDVVMDGRTTEICTNLNGVVVPVDHPYVKTYYPPNHFGCRTTVRKLRNGKVTENLPYPEIPDMFRLNLGEQGLIFPPGHAYYSDLPDKVKQGGMAAMRKNLFDNAKQRLIGSEIEVNGFGKVEFSVHGIKEMINQPHRDYMLKNQLATVANRLLEKSALLHSEEVNSDKAKAFHYLGVKGLPDNYLVIREMQDGRKVMYSIVDAIKKL
ncbi:MAG: phage minor head protein [Bacteroidota bacterium]